MNQRQRDFIWDKSGLYERSDLEYLSDIKELDILQREIEQSRNLEALDLYYSKLDKKISDRDFGECKDEAGLLATDDNYARDAYLKKTLPQIKNDKSLFEQVHRDERDRIEGLSDRLLIQFSINDFLDSKHASPGLLMQLYDSIFDLVLCGVSYMGDIDRILEDNHSLNINHKRLNTGRYSGSYPKKAIDMFHNYHLPKFVKNNTDWEFRKN